MLFSRITLTRNAPDDVQDRWIRINIDDEPEEILRYGEILSREVPPGHHRVRAHNTMTKAVVEFDSAPGQEVRIRCNNTVARGGMLMMLTTGFAVLRTTLEIEPADPS